MYLFSMEFCQVFLAQKGLKASRDLHYLAQTVVEGFSQGTSRAELHFSPRSDNNKMLRKHTIKS